MRNVEILLAQQPTVCAGGDVVTHDVEFQIEESLPPFTTGAVAISEACLAEHEALRELVAAANEVYAANRDSQSCG